MTSFNYRNISQGWTGVLRLDAPSDMNCASKTGLGQGQEPGVASGRVRSQTQPNTQQEQGSIRRCIVLLVRVHWLT